MYKKIHLYSYEESKPKRKKLNHIPHLNAPDMKKAYRLGAERAKRGGRLPSDLQIQVKNNFNEEQIDALKKGFFDHLKSPEEQGIRRAQLSGKLCAIKGRDIPPYRVLSSKYTEKEIQAYTNAYMKNCKTPEIQRERRLKNLRYNQNTMAKSTQSENTPIPIESPKETFIRQFINHQLQNIEAKHKKEIIAIDDNDSPIDNTNSEHAPINTEHGHDKIPSPYDILKKMSPSNHDKNRNDNLHYFEHFSNKADEFDTFFEHKKETDRQGNEEAEIERIFNLFNPNL